MYHEYTEKKRKKEISAERWFIRGLIRHGGSTAVIIPVKLIKWDRRRAGEPFRWSPGDLVRIAITPKGKLVIEPTDMSHLRGHEVDEELEQYTDQLTAAVLPKRLRKKRRVTIWGDGGPERVIWEDADQEVEVAGSSKLTWGQEVKRFRAYCDVTQWEASRRLGVTQTTISNWEMDKTEPSVSKREAFRYRMLTIKEQFDREKREEKRERGSDVKVKKRIGRKRK